MNKHSLTDKKNKNMSHKNHQRSKNSSQPAFLDNIASLIQPKPGVKPRGFEESFFKKIASKKSLSHQDDLENPNNAMFDFYVFNDGYENYETNINLKLPLDDRMVDSALTKFHNGVTLIILQKILNLVKDNHFLDFSSKMVEIKKNSLILRKIIEEIDDKFALTLLNRELFSDLEDYLSVYLFSSTVYQGKILDYIKKLFQKKFFTGLERDSERAVFDMTQFMRDIVAKSSIEKTISFVYMQILEELDIAMDIYASFLNINGVKTKVKLYDCRLSSKCDPKYLLVLLQIETGFSLCFGNRIFEASEGLELMSAFRSKTSKHHTSLRGSNQSSEKFLKYQEQSYREATSMIKGSQFSPFSSKHMEVVKTSMGQERLKTFINIEERFISKTFGDSYNADPNSSQNFEVTPMRNNFKMGQEALTRSDDKFLKERIIEGNLMKEMGSQGGMQSEKKSKPESNITEIKGRIEKLKTHGAGKAMVKTESMKKLRGSGKGKKARPSTILSKNAKNSSERGIKKSRRSHFTSHKTSKEEKIGLGHKTKRKSLRFATTGSVLDKIKKNKKKLKEETQNKRRLQGGQNGKKKSKSCKKSIKRDSHKQVRLSKQIARSSSKIKTNLARRGGKVELDEIAEGDERKGYFIADEEPRIDQIDELIIQNNLAITTVLQKFKSTPSKQVIFLRENFLDTLSEFY